MINSIDDTYPKRFTSLWLMLGVSALIISGLYAILLVASRTPGVSSFIPWIDFFHTALVVHVDLSVLIWFLAFSCVIWSHHANCRYVALERGAFILACIGTAGIAIAPFTGDAHPSINNYIPMLQQDFFIYSLSLFGVGFFLKSMLRLIELPSLSTPALITGSWFASLCSALGCLALITSYLTLSTDMPTVTYYEQLFWGSGHILQINNTILLLVAWLLLSQQITSKSFFIKDSFISLLFLLTALPVLYAVYIYIMYLDDFLSFHYHFMQMMKYGGLASIPLGFLIIPALFSRQQKGDSNRPLHAALVNSFLLFLAGGILGFMIEGVNVVIPAHYHGSIVGVTLAFIGLSYYLMPHLGLAITLPKLAFYQSYIYGAGQLMHITGLAWSGGYGVQRKTAGAAQGLDNLPEVVGMGMMGLGGLIAIIGGMLFVIVFLHALYHRN